MGGCCFKQSHIIAAVAGSEDELAPAPAPAPAPAQGQNPGAPQAQVMLSSQSGVTNQEISSAGTNISGLAPGPSNVALDVTHTAPVVQQIRSDELSTSLQTASSSSTQEIVTGDNDEASSSSGKQKVSECGVQTSLRIDPATGSGSEPPRPKILEEEEDRCSICLDEFDAGNPAYPTTCGHKFHLKCIRDWLQRSKVCPLCKQDTAVKTPTN